MNVGKIKGVKAQEASWRVGRNNGRAREAVKSPVRLHLWETTHDVTTGIIKQNLDKDATTDKLHSLGAPVLNTELKAIKNAEIRRDNNLLQERACVMVIQYQMNKPEILCMQVNIIQTEKLYLCKNHLLFIWMISGLATLWDRLSPMSQCELLFW